MTLKEKQEYVKKLREKRRQLRAKARELDAKRAEHIKKEMAKRGQRGVGFDDQVLEILRKQGGKKIEFGFGR